MNKDLYKGKMAKSQRNQDQAPGNYIGNLLEHDLCYSKYGYPDAHSEDAWEANQEFLKHTSRGQSTFTANKSKKSSLEY